MTLSARVLWMESQRDTAKSKRFIEDEAVVHYLAFSYAYIPPISTIRVGCHAVIVSTYELFTVDWGLRGRRLYRPAHHECNVRRRMRGLHTPDVADRAIDKRKTSLVVVPPSVQNVGLTSGPPRKHDAGRNCLM